MRRPPPPQITGVQVKRSTGGYAARAAAATDAMTRPTLTGVQRSTTAVAHPVVAASAAPMRPVAATAGAGPKKKVSFGAEEAPVPKLVITEAEAPALLTFEPVAAATAEETATATAVVARLKKDKSDRVLPITRPAPADAPAMTVDEFATVEMGQPIKERLSAKDSLKATPPMKTDGTVRGPIYRPINSASFPDFVIQSYIQMSPILRQVLEEGRGFLDKPQKIRKDACKLRDPNDVQTFYYQEFVRDYLTKGTPYRGLLVYHGLGSGKTCTSIAAAEALYNSPKKKIWVLTPATLSNNYRRELGKCGYYPLRSHNHWSFMKVDMAKALAPAPSKDRMAYLWLTESVLGLPTESVQRQGGAWIPDPTKPSNWIAPKEEGAGPAAGGRYLTSEERELVRAQQREHLNYRFKFIHYNGVTPTVLATLAAQGVRDGKSIFDDSVIVIDEIHNLVRTINGTQIGGKPISQVIERGIEPREFSWSTPLGRERPGFRYPRGYTLYRLLQNAVGAKIVALSATPMINYAQELAVLMNMVGGEQRVCEISLKKLDRSPAAMRKLETWAKQRPDIDFYSIEESLKDRSSILTVTPVPFGFMKVVDPAADYATRGFVRVPDLKVGDPARSRERNMDVWCVGLLKDLAVNGLLPESVAEEASAATSAARAAGVGTPIATDVFQCKTFPMLPEDATEFVANFVNRTTLEIQHKDILKSRATGLISYYRGGSKELMPRSKSHLVEVPMSEYMFKEYTKARKAEQDMEAPAEKKEDAGAGAGPAKARRGMTMAEMDLYAQATKTQQTGFLALSRAACNWVFPEEVPRPSMNAKQQAKLLGLDQEARLVAADLAVDVDGEMDAASAPARGAGGGGGGGGGDGPEAEAEQTDAVLPDEAPAEPVIEPLDAALQGIIGTLMSGLEAKGDEYLNTNLAQFSPKYAVILENIRKSSGPVLVYSQFKTLEGLGIFAAALRAAPEKFLPLDLVKSGGEWEIPAALMTPDVLARPRYVLYTGDQDLDKRRLLLQLYNADVDNLPPRLAAQCKQLMGDAPDNRDGRICKVFMITQSGAEGISLFNTRQVHVMEPYWNNVRLQQVIGRAIRLCSHMNLPWGDRKVEVFTYITSFSAEQKASGNRIIANDRGMTTDQMIFDIATKKQKLADGLFEIAQTAAVDCQLHFHEHKRAMLDEELDISELDSEGEEEAAPVAGAVKSQTVAQSPDIGIKCFVYEPGKRPLFLYHPDWHRDINAAGAGR